MLRELSARSCPSRLASCASQLAVLCIALLPGIAAQAGDPGTSTDESAGVVNYNRIEVADGFAGTVVGFGGATPPAMMASMYSG